MNRTWNEIAAGLQVKGKKVNDAWCRKKRKTLRDYYYKVRKMDKGKSGDGARDKKPWTYFNAMDRVLSSYNEENESTQSNFPGDDSSGIKDQTSLPSEPSGIDNESYENARSSGTESTPTGTWSNRRARKRKSDTDANEILLNEKILKVLEEPEEVKDQFYHFGMTICNRLRNAPPQRAEYAMIRISSLLYEIMYPVEPTSENSENQATYDESTHEDLIIMNK